MMYLRFLTAIITFRGEKRFAFCLKSFCLQSYLYQQINVHFCKRAIAKFQGIRGDPLFFRSLRFFMQKFDFLFFSQKKLCFSFILNSSMPLSECISESVCLYVCMLMKQNRLMTSAYKRNSLSKAKCFGGQKLSKFNKSPINT